VVAKHIARRNFLIIRVLARAMAFFVADESVDVQPLFCVGIQGTDKALVTRWRTVRRSDQHFSMLAFTWIKPGIGHLEGTS
jgi:hypothetical protein